MKMIKLLIKKILPDNLVFRYKKHSQLKVLEALYKYDRDRYFRYSNIFYSNTKEKSIGKIVHTYHVIEKGLTMPEMRLGFGRSKLLVLINECLKYRHNYDISNEQFLHAVGVIVEYKQIHELKGYELDEELNNKIDQLIKGIEVPEVHQNVVSKKDFYKYIEYPFNIFSESRKSVRSFEGKVEIEDIEKAISLAQNTPSACNRQPVRVHVIVNRDKINHILDIQNGNRGFGHLADKLIILSSDLSSNQGPEERNLPFIDGGMYAMNLLYALHFYKIATCPLNWATSPDKDTELRNTLSISESEEVFLIIACGNAPDEFSIAASKRNNYMEIMKIH